MNYLSPSLTSAQAEFFADATAEYGTINGVTYAANDLPEAVKDILYQEIERDAEVRKELEIMQPEKDKQLGQFIRCRYPRFDGSPDIDLTGQLGAPEYGYCCKRGMCRAEGILCTPVQLCNGALTKRETQVLRLIGAGLMDKEICSELFIAKDTLRNHKDSISRKAGVERKAALAVVAYICGVMDSL